MSNVYFLTITIFFSSEDDISHNKNATQSHTCVGIGYDASKAVDRDIHTCMRTISIGINSPEKTVWWRVEFGGVYNIYRINKIMTVTVLL